jgi:Tol biopolymer transport system component
MKSILIGTLAAILVAGAQSNEAERQLKAAMNAELVNGDLKTAIKQYGEIAAKHKNDRAVAAMALVRMAEAYHKLGDAESRKVYERVLREYGDQKEAAAQARAGLGVRVVSNSGGSTRQLWTKVGGSPYGPVSPNGRYIAFTSYEEGVVDVPNIAVHDFVTGADLVLTNSRNPQDHPTRTGRVFSADSKQIAYPWVIIDNGEEHSEIRISEVNAISSAKPRVLFRTVDRLQVNDWSPDGKWIALQILRKDRTRQLGLVSTTDGSLRVLKSSDWSGSGNVYFSPDSKYVAFDVTLGEGSNPDILVLSIDGSHGVPAVTHPASDRVAGWTPDGKQLLFISDRNGLPALWWMPIEGGKPHGSPELLRPNFGKDPVRGPGRSSGLYYEVLGGSVRVSVGALDLAAGKINPASVQQFTADIYPAWSPDGKYLASNTYTLTGGNIFLTVRALETGRIRELRPQLNYTSWPSWSPDSRSLLVQGTDLKGRRGIFRVDAQTAEAESIVIGEEGENLVTPQWFPDDKRILYERDMWNESVIVERELTSGKESEIVRFKTLRSQASASRSFLLSPDGRSLAYLTSNGISAHTAIMLKPLVGGEPRELLKLSQVTFLSGWTPDGQSLLYAQKENTGNRLLDVAAWILPVSEGEPRRLQLGENFAAQLVMHPDGKQIAFWSNNQTGEQIWVLENHLPTLTTKK